MVGGGHKLKDGMMDGPLEHKNAHSVFNNSILQCCAVSYLRRPLDLAAFRPLCPDFLETACVLKKRALHTDFFLRARCQITP